MTIGKRILQWVWLSSYFYLNFIMTLCSIYTLSLNSSKLIILFFASKTKEVYVLITSFHLVWYFSLFYFIASMVSTFRCIWKPVLISSNFLTYLFIYQDCVFSWTWALKIWLHLGPTISTLQSLILQVGHHTHPTFTWILWIWTQVCIKSTLSTEPSLKALHTFSKHKEITCVPSVDILFYNF